MKDKVTNYEQVKIFREAYKDLESIYEMFPKLCGLSGTEYWALSMIHEGITTQHSICENLSISRQTVNSAFRQLKKRGLIYLETMDNNLRVKQIHLTKEGKEFVDREITNMHKLEENVWKAMDKEEKIMITKLLCKYKSLLLNEIENYKKNYSSSEDL